MTAKEFADKLDRMTLPEIMNAINSQTAEKNGLTVIVPDGDGIVRFYGVHNENIQIDFTGYASAFITKKKTTSAIASCPIRRTRRALSCVKGCSRPMSFAIFQAKMRAA